MGVLYLQKYIFSATDDLLTVTVNNGQFVFKIKVHPDFTPYIQIVAYVVLSCDKLLSHSAKFHTEKCFKNEVSGRFSKCDVQIFHYLYIVIYFKACQFLVTLNKDNY